MELIFGFFRFFFFPSTFFAAHTHSKANKTPAARRFAVILGSDSINQALDILKWPSKGFSTSKFLFIWTRESKFNKICVGSRCVRGGNQVRATVVCQVLEFGDQIAAVWIGQ